MKEETVYTYYEVELVDTPLEWNFTICESLDDVRNVLQFADVFLDDETRETKVIIKGIGMTREAYNDWKKENLHEDAATLLNTGQSAQASVASKAQSTDEPLLPNPIPNSLPVTPVTEDELPDFKDVTAKVVFNWLEDLEKTLGEIMKVTRIHKGCVAVRFKNGDPYSIKISKNSEATLD